MQGEEGRTLKTLTGVLILAVLMAGAGCGVKIYQWTCADSPCDPVRLQQDHRACAQEANSTYVPWIAGPGPQRTIYKDCMESRHYVKVSSQTAPCRRASWKECVELGPGP